MHPSNKLNQSSLIMLFKIRPGQVIMRTCLLISPRQEELIKVIPFLDAFKRLTSLVATPLTRMVIAGAHSSVWLQSDRSEMAHPGALAAG